MPRTITLGNGNMLVGLDRFARVRDFYFPHVGLENHISNHNLHRVGVWVDGKFSWLHDGSWEIAISCKHETLSAMTRARNDALGVELVMTDVVYNEANIFVRHVSVRNTAKTARTIKVFFGQEFEINQSHKADTSYYDPHMHALVHYKGRVVISVNAMSGENVFDDYTTGVAGFEDKTGSYLDAEDGQLSKNAIEHGPADSVLGMTLLVGAQTHADMHYWMCAAESIREIKEMNEYVIEKTPGHLITTTMDYWNAWANKEKFQFDTLDPKLVEAFKKSMFYVRAHVDNGGAILASSDTDMMQGGKDTYGYMWPRDGAFSAMALGQAGDANVAHRFFEFCNEVITDEGYFMHKYGPDYSLGSSWHPWLYDGEEQLPIQEDETASVIIALWRHYEITHDLEFIEQVYNSLIKKAADFMVRFRDSKTKLPSPSYDLWEEKFGIHTYTAASVYGALIAASRFADLLGKRDAMQEYIKAAHEIQEAIIKYLYDDEQGYFVKSLSITSDGDIAIDRTVDMSSVYGIYAFGVLPHNDTRVERAIAKVESDLMIHNAIGGVVRYQEDNYYRIDSRLPGNPWFITTFWLAQYYAATAKTEDDLLKVRGWLNWGLDHTLDTGVMSEQVNPHTGEQISVAPLTWSHAEYVLTVIAYLDAMERLGLCIDCNPVS